MDARLEVLLSRVKEDILKTEAEGFNYLNLSKEESRALKISPYNIISFNIYGI